MFHHHLLQLDGICPPMKAVTPWIQTRTGDQIALWVGVTLVLTHFAPYGESELGVGSVRYFQVCRWILGFLE